MIRTIRTAGNEELRALLSEALSKAEILYRQQRNSREKFYSWRAPEVDCIGKDKAAKPYEFGCKVSVTSHINPAPAGHFVLHIGALHGRPLDGHTLKPVSEEYERQIGIRPERVYVDKGYRDHAYEPKNSLVLF